MNTKLIFAGIGIAGVSLIASQYVEFGTIGSVPSIAIFSIIAGILIGLGFSSQVFKSFKSPNIKKYVTRR